MEPSKFTLAPIGAIENILEITGWDKSEVDLFEINEAFAMVTMLATKELDLDPVKSTSMVEPARRAIRLAQQDQE